MILNENVPCRASRAWWLPFASLTLGLFAVPVAAQRDPQDPAPVEIRVNGKQVDELSSAERQALLRKLLAAEEKPVPKPGKLEQAPKTDLKPRKSTKRAKIDPAIGFDDMQGVDIGAMVREGLAEARREIESDPDLRELGITDEVARLIEDIGAGKGIENSLDAIIKSALQGATKMVEQELRSDEDLKALGLTDGILKMVTGFLQNPRNQEMISDFALRQAKQAIEGVVAELRHDEGSKSLGIEHDVGSLLGDLLHGGDFDGHLQQILDKALNHAGKAATIELDTGAGMTQDREEKAPPVKKAKGKKNKERREEVR